LASEYESGRTVIILELTTVSPKEASCAIRGTLCSRPFPQKEITIALPAGKSRDRVRREAQEIASSHYGWQGALNLLIMRLDNMGDVIMTGPALRAVKRALPRSRLTFMASPAGAEIAPLLPWVDDVFAARVLWQDLNGLPFDPGREKALIREIRDRRFDGAIVFTSFSQSPYPAGLACLLAGIPLRLGNSKERDEGVFTTMPPPIAEDTHQVDRNLQLLRAIDIDDAGIHLFVKVDECSRRASERLLSERGLRAGSPYVLLNPWASAQARTYPTERFSEVALELARRSGLPVVVTGDRKHLGWSEAFKTGSSREVLSIIGLTTARELAALVEGAILVLTNNTSTMHLAEALGTPMVVLYSGTELESQWRPRVTPHRLLRRSTPCSPCYAFTCPFHLECLDFAPREVVSTALELLCEEQ
jgi:ADP-heptose:LPS heptosyltransferase